MLVSASSEVDVSFKSSTITFEKCTSVFATSSLKDSERVSIKRTERHSQSGIHFSHHAGCSSASFSSTASYGFSARIASEHLRCVLLYQPNAEAMTATTRSNAAMLKLNLR